MTSIIAEKTPIIPIRGSMYFSHLSNVVPAISNVNRINPVGVIKDIQPCPQLYALITTSSQVFNIFIEINLRCRSKPISALSQINLVEI